MTHISHPTYSYGVNNLTPTSVEYFSSSRIQVNPVTTLNKADDTDDSEPGFYDTL